MTISLKHTFQSTIADSADATLVRPSNWNAEHDLTQASNTMLARTSVGDGPTEELTPESGRTFLGLSSVDSPTFLSVEIGAADATLTRVSSGLVAVEGDTIALLSHAQTFNAKQTFSNIIKTFLNLEESNVSVSPTGVSSGQNYDVLTQGTLYFTGNNSANWTLNIRGTSTVALNTIMALEEVITINLFATNGSTAFFQNALTIDGASFVPKWLGGTAPSAGTVNSVDRYTITIIKTAASSYAVFESQTTYSS